MSASETIEITGASTLAEPEAALAAALDEVVGAMIGAGAGPHHLTAMTWAAAEPAAIHPSRFAIDRIYREALGGFRPPIALARGEGPGVAVRARLRSPGTPPTEPLWHDLAAPVLAREYSPRGQVPSMAAVFAQWTRDGAAARAASAGRDLTYGPSRRETLDFYRPARIAKPPLWIFIHGGYWQASDKEQHSQFLTGMLTAGFAVANLDYGLAPETPLAGAVAQVRAAVRFLAAAADDLGFDARQMHVAGHSAGGHLAAMAAADPDGPPLVSALLLSGLFDLRPLALLPVGRLLGLTDADAVARLSPTALRPPPGLRVGVALGARESAEFKWQSEEIAAKWGAPAPTIVPDEHHFSLLEGLRGGALLDLALRTAGR